MAEDVKAKTEKGQTYTAPAGTVVDTGGAVADFTGGTFTTDDEELIGVLDRLAEQEDHPVGRR